MIPGIPTSYYENAREEFVSYLLTFTFMMSLGGLVWGGICLYFGLLTPAIIPFGYVAFSVLNLGFWYASKSFSAARFLQVAASISLPFLFQWFMGGYIPSGVVMLWALLALVASLTFHKPKYTFFWLLYFLVLTAVSGYLDDYFYDRYFVGEADKSVEALLLTLNVSLIGSMIFFLSSLFVTHQRKTAVALENGNRLLDQKNEHLASKQQELEQQSIVLEEANVHLQASEEEIRQTLEELTITNEQLAEAKVGLEDSLLRESAAKEALQKAMTTELAKKNRDIMSSLNYARRIQRLLMPNQQDVIATFEDAFIFLQAKDVVSGDFFWYEEVTDAQNHTKQIIAAVDCTGHGVPGALMSMIGLEQLTEIVNVERISDAGPLLTRLHEGVKVLLKQETSQNKDGMDMALCVIDREKKILQYAGAKNPLVYVQNGELHMIKADRQPIGSIIRNREAKPFEQHTVALGDEPTTFYIFSDGFQDQFGGADNKKFMTKRFRQLLFSIHNKPMREQKKILARTLVNWKGELAQTDDILVIGFRV